MYRERRQQNNTSKISIFIALIFLCGLVAQGQNQINYKILEDNPSNNPTKYINLEWFGLDGNGVGDNDGGLGLFLGVSGMWDITPLMSVEGNFRWKYLNLGDRAGIPIHLETGAFYNFGSKNKSKNIKVITSYKEDRLSNTSTTTFFEAPGTVLRKYNFRGGLIQHRDTYIKSGGFGATNNFYFVGTYIGVDFVTQTRLLTEVTEGNSTYEADASIFIRVYADIIPYPILITNATNFDYRGGLGWRFGLLWMWPNGINFARKLSVFAEIGRRPVDKGYMTIGCGFSLFRSK